MWKCVKCREQVDDEFEVCWNCGTSSEGIEDNEFKRAEDIRAEELETTPPLPDSAPVVDQSTAIQEIPQGRSGDPAAILRRSLLCPRCDHDLDFVGTKSFHEGFQWGGLLGDWGEFFVNQESFDLYVCRRCGRVEFFVSGIGDEFRPHEATE